MSAEQEPATGDDDYRTVALVSALPTCSVTTEHNSSAYQSDTDSGNNYCRAAAGDASSTFQLHGSSQPLSYTSVDDIQLSSA